MKNIFCSFVRDRLLAVFLFSPSIVSLTHAQVIEINPVEVTATRMEQKLSDAIPAISVITKEEIVRSNAGDISELLAGQAGIEFARSGGVGAPISIYMRGSGSTQTMVLVDGIPFSSQSAIGSISPIHTIPINQIDRVEILRGNAAAIYGSGAMGGVINLITTSKDTKGFNPSGSITYGRYNTTRSSAGFDGGSDDFNYSFSGAHNQSKGFEAISSYKYTCSPSSTPFYSSGCINPNSNGYIQNSLRATINKAIDSGSSIGVKLFHSTQKNSFDNYLADTASQTWENKDRTEMFQFYIKNRISDSWTSNISLSHSQNDAKTLSNGVLNSYYGRYITDHQILNWINSYELTKSQLISFGYEKDSSKLGSELINDGSTNQKAIKSRAFTALLSNYGNTSTQLNLSHDMMPSVGNTNTYLIGATYSVDSNIKASISNSTAVATPTLGQLYDLPSGGVPTLKPEYAKTTEVGVQYLDKSTFARAVIFDSKYRNLLASGSTSVDNVYWANYVTKWENVNSSHNTGLEIQLKKRINKTEIASNFTHQSLVNQGSIQVFNKARNYGNFDINYFYDDKFDLGMGFLFTSSRRTYSPDYVKTHTPGYSVFRLHTSYKFSDQLRGIGSLENAFNKNYYQIYGYNTTGRSIYATLQYQPK